MALENGEIRGPAGSGLVSAVARKDTSRVAAEILLNPKEWENQTLNLDRARGSFHGRNRSASLKRDR